LKTTLHTDRKQKEPEKGKYVPQRMKLKFFKEVAIQDLTKEDLENISDQFREVTDDLFQCVTYQQEEMHKNM
jgi:hypothetical protein